MKHCCLRERRGCRAAAGAQPPRARDQIQVAGSSTVLPYAKIVAERSARPTDFKTPVVESGGSGAGIKQFCEGVGEDKIDIANSSRPINDRRAARPARPTASTDVQEVKIGYDGIVFATDISGPDFAIQPVDIYKALAAQVVVDGKLVDNPLHQVDPR